MYDGTLTSIRENFLIHMGVVWIFPCDITLLISGWCLFGLEEIPSAVWSYLPSALCWNIWKERNRRIFGNKVSNPKDLCVFIYNSIHDWCLFWKEYNLDMWYTLWSRENFMSSC